MTTFHLESVYSDFNEELSLYLVNNRLQLTTQNAIYSYDDYYYNFHETFDSLRLPPNGSKILILGWALGSIPFILEKKYHRSYYYTGIEIDENVLYLYHKYQSSRIKSPVEIIQADAFSFLPIHSENYDMICVDLFIGDQLPTESKTKLFADALYHHLTPGGCLIWNTLNANRIEQEENKAIHHELLQPLFSTIESKEILGNRILIGIK